MSAASNAIVLENQRPGTPESVWQLSGPPSANIEGFTTNISVNSGSNVDFKINTDSSNYRVEIYRIGYYGGDGARLVTTIEHQGGSAIVQPAPIADAAKGLVDAGNWQVTDTWGIPADAVSGVYMAKLVRQDGTPGENMIPFVVRNDNSNSAIVFQTSDETWQAYNPWGGNSLYTGGAPTPSGAATAVSYNRPFATQNANSYNYFFGEEYPAIRWLEENGYDVSYISDLDTATNGSQLLNHKTFLSVGHDEYWSASQRANVEAARNAGVNLEFWGGNDVFSKTELLPSIDGTQTPDRTLVCYKTTFTGLTNPDGVWTGEWRDPAGGTVPENALTGTMYMADQSPPNQITIPYQYSGLRFWNNTAVAALQPGQTWSLPAYLGTEWDVDANNGFRPPGLIDLSSTTVDPANLMPQPWRMYQLPGPPGSATHNLTLYRASSGAMVFSAGTILWAWGLDPDHVGAGTPADPNVQQAMVNLFAEMGVQPATLQSNLVAATSSNDRTPPVSTITAVGTPIIGVQSTISGTASDAGGGVVAGLEVSTDYGTTWHPATGTTSWTYSWTPTQPGVYTILSRAVDDSLNLGSPATSAAAAIAFAGPGGTLHIDGTSMPVAMIYGFAPGDRIDLAGVSFDRGGSIQLKPGNVLEIGENGQTYDLKLDPAQNFAGLQFVLDPSQPAGSRVTAQVPSLSPSIAGNVDEWLMANGHWAASAGPGSHPGSGWQVAGIGDFYNDGTSDVLWYNSSTRDVDEWKIANGGWAGSIDLGAHPGSGWQIAGIGDFNHDGTSDVLWYNSGTGQVDEWLMANGQWAASVSPGSHPGSGWQVAGIGDFYHDGTSDVLWYNSGTGHVDEWKLTNGQLADSVDLGVHPGTGWQIAGIGDFNHDGTDDVLWYNSGTGQTDEWQMANGQLAASVSPGTHPGSGWQVAGIGDFNHDGTDDVLWYNSGTGQTDEWLMANGKWAASVDLGVHPGSGWQVAGIGDFNHTKTSSVLWYNSSQPG